MDEVTFMLKRNWSGSEIGSIEDIVNRFDNNIDLELLNRIEKENNVLFTEDQVKLRKKNYYWC